MTHICVNKLTTIGSDNGLSPGRRQAIIWTNAVMLSIWCLGTNFSEISIKSHTFSIKKIHLKMSSGKWRPFCLGLNVLILWCWRGWDVEGGTCNHCSFYSHVLLRWFCLWFLAMRKAYYQFACFMIKINMSFMWVNYYTSKQCFPWQCIPNNMLA